MFLKDEVALYQQLRFEQDNRFKEDLSSLDEKQLESLLSELKKETKNNNEPNSLK